MASGVNGLKRDSDADNDNPTNSRYDTDDNAVLSYGHLPASGEIQRIVTLIKRYYRAAAAADGRKGCLLLYSRVAEIVPEEYGEVDGLRGGTCASVMSKIFERHHKQLVADVATLKTVLVRVGGDRGLALLRFGANERRVLVHRETHVWKIDSLLDMAVP